MLTRRVGDYPYTVTFQRLPEREDGGAECVVCDETMMWLATPSFLRLPSQKHGRVPSLKHARRNGISQARCRGARAAAPSFRGDASFRAGLSPRLAGRPHPRGPRRRGCRYAAFTLPKPWLTGHSPMNCAGRRKGYQSTQPRSRSPIQIGAMISNRRAVNLPSILPVTSGVGGSNRGQRSWALS
jgi:hypothetical protein